jgi:hypothetical protein
MDLCRDKYVCLVLTCKKPYYQDRLQENIETFEYLQDIGFQVVLLYADPAILSYKWNFYKDTKFLELTVPCEELYLFLSVKLDLAYKVLAQSGCKGILKIDDDTKINKKKCMLKFVNTIAPNYDYFGISWQQFDSQYFIMNRPSFNLKNMKLYFHLPSPVRFFIGSFYWISHQVLEYISIHSLSLPLEDLSVGFLVQEMIKTHPLKCGFKDWNTKGYISWSYDSEPLPKLTLLNTNNE